MNFTSGDRLQRKVFLHLSKKRIFSFVPMFIGQPYHRVTVGQKKKCIDQFLKCSIRLMQIIVRLFHRVVFKNYVCGQYDINSTVRAQSLYLIDLRRVSPPQRLDKHFRHRVVLSVANWGFAVDFFRVCVVYYVSFQHRKQLGVTICRNNSLCSTISSHYRHQTKTATDLDYALASQSFRALKIIREDKRAIPYRAPKASPIFFIFLFNFYVASS